MPDMHELPGTLPALEARQSDTRSRGASIGVEKRS